MCVSSKDKQMSGNAPRKWNASIVVILKDEVDYIENWIIHHLAIGFEHIFIYDNISCDNIVEKLNKFISGGVVTYIGWPVRAGQIDAYNHALTLLRHNTEWFGFFDVDEYVVLHDHEDIGAYLAAYDADQILLPWRNFPYGGHKSPPGGTDQENYLWAHRARPDGSVQTKHFVRASAARHVTAHFSLISTNKTIIADGTASSPTHLIDGPSYRGAQINHYATRSYVENAARLQKGQVDGGAEKQLATFFPLLAEHVENLDYDDSILRHFGKFAEERERWAHVSETPHRYGLMQRTPVLPSWNNVPFFFAKSFANYLAGRPEIAHGTNLALTHVDASGKESELRRFWHNSDLHSVHFRVDEQSFHPFFMGTIHYGDFVRRFGFEARRVVRECTVAEAWSQTLIYSGQLLGAIFDLTSESGVEIVVTEDKTVTKIGLPPGRHAGLVYSPVYFHNIRPVTLNIVGACRLREMIIGALP